jgi:hypothetical protein
MSKLVIARQKFTLNSFVSYFQQQISRHAMEIMKTYKLTTNNLSGVTSQKSENFNYTAAETSKCRKTWIVRLAIFLNDFLFHQDNIKATNLSSEERRTVPTEFLGF